MKEGREEMKKGIKMRKDMEDIKRGQKMNKGMVSGMMGVACLILLFVAGALLSSCDSCPYCPPPVPPRNPEDGPTPTGLAEKIYGCSDEGSLNFRVDADGNSLVELENDDCSCEYAGFKKLTPKQTKLNVKNVLVEGYTESRAGHGAVVQILLDKGQAKTSSYVEDRLEYPIDFQYLYMVTHTAGSEVNNYTKTRYLEFEFPPDLGAPPLINVENINRIPMGNSIPLSNERVFEFIGNRLSIYSEASIALETVQRGERLEGLLSFRMEKPVGDAIVSRTFELLLLEDSVVVSNQNNESIDGREVFRAPYPTLFAGGKNLPEFTYRFLVREQIVKGKILTPHALLDGLIYTRYFGYDIPKENSLTGAAYRPKYFYLIAILYRDDTNEVMNCVRIRPGESIFW